MTVARPPVSPVEEKVRNVESILAGEVSVAEAARRVKVSEQSVGNWKRQFLEAGELDDRRGDRPRRLQGERVSGRRGPDDLELQAPRRLPR